MTVGAGKYDFALELALGNAEAERGVLIIFDGKQGAGFSVQACKDSLMGLPEVLENIAEQVRRDLPDLT